MKISISIVLLVAFLNTLIVQNAYANQQAQVCTACHGTNGISTDPNVPNLAGQQQAYLVSQLNAFKSKDRKNPLMNAIAANLSNDEINALATFFNQQKSAALDIEQATVSGSLSSVIKKNQLTFPANFPSDYQLYTTVNRDDNKQVRYLYVDNAAMKVFKQKGELPINSNIVMEIYKAKLNDAGEPMKNNDGFYQKDVLAAYATMKKEQGWGKKIPQEIRNGDWKYGFFKSNKEHHPTRNIAKCMACHQPLSAQEFMFSFESLNEHLQARK